MVIVLIILQLLDSSLFDLLDRNEFQGFSLNLVRLLAWHILQALAFLARPDVNVIHCDLKPENIMLCHQHSPAIQVRLALALDKHLRNRYTEEVSHILQQCLCRTIYTDWSRNRTQMQKALTSSSCYSHLSREPE